MGRKLGTGNVMRFGLETQVSRGQEAQGCYCTAFSTAYARRRWVEEIRFGSVCCAWVLLYRENTVKTSPEQSPGRAGKSDAVVAALLLLEAWGLQTRTLVQTQTLARAERGWLLLWLCRGPRKDRPMMSLGWQVRRAAARFRGLALMDGLLSWTAEGARETEGCTRGKYFAEQNRCLCGSMHCLDLLVVGSFDSS